MTGDILAALGGVGLFLIGMHMLSGGLRALAGDRLRMLLARFTRTPLSGALTGAAVGTVAAGVAVFLLPAAQEDGGFLTGLGFHGWQWLWLLVIPPLAAAVAFAATQAAARKTLKDTP